MIKLLANLFQRRKSEGPITRPVVIVIDEGQWDMSKEPPISIEHLMQLGSPGCGKTAIRFVPRQRPNRDAWRRSGKRPGRKAR